MFRKGIEYVMAWNENERGEFESLSDYVDEIRKVCPGRFDGIWKADGEPTYGVFFNADEKEFQKFLKEYNLCVQYESNGIKFLKSIA